MGAELWYHEAPWDPDPDAALKGLQAHFLAEHYNLPALLPEHLVSAHQAVDATKADGDSYGLLDIYEEQVKLLESLCNQPIPRNPQEQIQILRQVYAIGGQGIGNVLDVTGVTEKREDFTAQRLSDEEMQRLVVSTRPNLAQACQAVDKIHEELQRGQCVCFPFFDANTGKPAGWYFVGNTVD